jgi:hypothetical protein
MSESKGAAAGGKVETCEACGAEFRCMPMGDCWCFHEAVTRQTLEDLRSRFARCMCRECLAKSAQPAQG